MTGQAVHSIQRFGASSKGAVVHTGPSGLVLGQGEFGPVALRLFNAGPTRVLISAPDYVKWVVVFRATGLGAQVNIITEDPSAWEALAEVVLSCGGSINVGSGINELPDAGRPYRPSLVVVDSTSVDGSQIRMGPWQSLLMVADASLASTIHLLRNCDVSLISLSDDKTKENLRRAYALSRQQLTILDRLETSELVVAMAHRAMKVDVPPTQTEYCLLFGG